MQLDEFIRIADCLPSALLVLREGMIEAANRRARRMLEGHIAKSWIGLPIHQLFENHAGSLDTFLRDAARTRTPCLGRLVIRSPEGHNFRCEGCLMPGVYKDGKRRILLRLLPQANSVENFTALNEKINELHHEIDQRKKTEYQLRLQMELVSLGLDIGHALSQKQSLRTILDDCAHILANYIKADAVFIVISEPVNEWRLKGTSSRLEASTDESIWLNQLQPIIEQVVENGDSQSIRTWSSNDSVFQSFGGRVQAALACPLVVDDRLIGLVIGLKNQPFPDDTVEAISTVSQEIGLGIERKRALSELARQTQALRKASRQKDEFLAMLAHELRNPLAPIRTGLDLLSDERTDCALVESMQVQIDHLVRLVDDLLDVARIMRGRIRIHHHTVPLRRVIQRAVATTRPLIDEQNHRLTITWPEQEVFVNGDPVRIAQIFGNLLNNAAKYTAPQGDIQIHIDTQDRDVLVTIRDNGIGIDAEFMFDMFQLFTQSERSLDRTEGGLGVGLTVVRQLVEIHGGQVTVHSDGHEQGSAFTVRLPMVDGPQPAADEDLDDRVASPPIPHRQLRILVVDDLRGAAKMMQKLLQRQWNHEVELAFDGETACEKAIQFRPDLVLLDIGLPGMNGYEVAQYLKSQPEMQAIRIVAVSGYGSEEDRRRSQQAGIDLHLVKPVGVDQLKQAFDQLVGLSTST